MYTLFSTVDLIHYEPLDHVDIPLRIWKVKRGKRPLNVSHESIERTHTQTFAEERADWRVGRRSFPEKSGMDFHAKVGTEIEVNTSIYYSHNQSVQYESFA
jgi:hypothetical protein